MPSDSLPSMINAPSSVTRTTATTTGPQCSTDHPRLFVVCGRSCQVDELRALFSTCGLIKHLHLALDRSKKSRGFAFLQYEDPEDAFAAIDTLDHRKLGDGHILKVTIAKERPVSGNGKVKRDQHARVDLDEKIEGVRQQEDDGGIEARLPGKRQRSSPPVVALPLGSSRATPGLDNQRLRICQLGTVNATNEKAETSVAREKDVLAADVCKDELVGPQEDQVQVEQVMCAMLVAVEKREVLNETNDDLLAMYLRVGSTLDQVKQQTKGENRKIVRPGSNEVSKEGKSTSTLAHSVRSGPLVPTPMKIHKVSSDAMQRADGVATRNGGAMPLHHVKQHLRRRRQSLEIAGSSTEDTSDGSGIRRKRSNTTTSPLPTQTAHVHTKFKALPPVEKLSDRSDVGLPPDATNAKVTLKKLCKRQSSENGIEELYRSTKQRATEDRRDHDSFVVDRRQDGPAAIKLEKSCVHDRSVKLESESKPAEPVHTKLFFTSTYKFTDQEVEAMFSVYGDFESAELVRSFGRVRTMAYIIYSKPSTAAFVVKSFKEESSQGDEDPERPEFMTLSFAHDTGLQQHEKPAQFHAGTARKCTSTSQSSHPLAKKPEPPISAILPLAGKDRLWVFLMYDRFLTTHMLSSVVSSLSGMEFMDIKVAKSTGETQGIAFVKFDSDTNATQAAYQLHQLELPLGSGKFLQAIAVQAPSLFSPSHESNSTSTQRLERTAIERAMLRSFEDTDLRVVEARFAHLMRSTEHSGAGEDQHFHHYSRIPSPGDATMGNQQSPMVAGVYTHSDGFHLGSSAGLEYHPMQLPVYPSPPPHQYFHPYASLGPGHWQQLAQQQGFGGNAPGWTETAPYYQDGTQQYPFACTPDQELTFSVHHDSNNMRRVEDSIATPLKPRYSRALSEQVGVEGTNSKCSNYTSRSIHVSTSEPLELVSLVSALQECPGLVSFAKSVGAESDRMSYTVDFSNEAQASEALCKLDGTLCRGQKLRVTKHTPTRHRGTGGGGKPRSGSGRRKRQRVDPRNRK
uniref:RRM domain-containing protein n=1 Tax=Peronospora matthiolae TaxID=2874970 RepID=A0AAV1VEP1_9STRA